MATEYLVFRRFFAADLAASVDMPTTTPPRREVPVFVLVVLALTLAVSWVGRVRRAML